MSRAQGDVHTMYQDNLRNGGGFAMPQGWKNSNYTSQFKLFITFFPLTLVIMLPFVMEGYG